MFSSIKSGPQGVLLTVSGALDGEGALALRPILEQIAQTANCNVVLNLEDVTYMDGSGIGALAFTFKRLAARGLKLRVEGAQGQALGLLRKLGVARILGHEPAPRRRLGFAAALGLDRAA